MQIMSIRNPISIISSVTVSYWIHHASLLQNTTDIIAKYDSTNFGTTLLQNATVFTKYDVYYKLRQHTNLCGKLRTNFCGSFILLFSVLINIISILLIGQ